METSSFPRDQLQRSLRRLDEFGPANVTHCVTFAGGEATQPDAST